MQCSTCGFSPTSSTICPSLDAKALGTWALDIVSYDWWIGIASGGLVVSAMLLLDAEWRGALNRITETMALVSAAAAGLYPIIHLGRPWFFYWNLPYPNTFLLWPRVRSPLFWDAVDIVSYLLVCLSFWYVGMLPDLAAMRDRAIERLHDGPGHQLRNLRAQLYGIAALGWRGSARHWQRWMQAYRTIALFGVLLVVSLQTGAAVMFAGTVEPGWHDALSPVTFLFGAIFSGVAMVAVLAVVLRSVFGLTPLITPRHPVAGTVARVAPNPPAAQPTTTDAALLARGQERFGIFCTPCHGRAGNGEGMIVQRGFTHPSSFVEGKLREAKTQVFYDAITNGYGAMYSFADRLSPADRWAVIAYIRALQLSQNADVAALPAEDRAQLEASARQEAAK